jgi:hypothetical protein
MLSFDGWSVGIAYCLKIILDTIFSIYVIFRAKKGNIKLLYFPAFAMLSIVIAYIPFAYDFIHILLTGQNYPINYVHLFIYLTCFQIDGFAFFYLAITLTISEKKKMMLILVSLYIIFVQMILIFLPNLGFFLEFPPYPGENLIKPYFSLNSVAFYLLLPYGVILIVFGFKLALKSLKMRGKLRNKYQTLAIGYVFGMVWLLLVYTSRDVGFLFAIFFVISFFIIWITFIYGLSPVREKKHKKKRMPSESELKFVSYLTKKTEDNRSLEDKYSSVHNINREIFVFMSYATKDADLFKVKETAEKLTNTAEIEKVLYWQEDMEDNIIEYMNDNLGKCHTFVLFCSKNALESVPVKKEWTAADAMGKPIIPVFFNPEHIPPLLRSRLGIEFDFYDIKRNVQGLYSLILKKCSGLEED